jgi:hypothetical protein
MGVLEVKLDQPGVVEEGREVVLGVGVRAANAGDPDPNLRGSPLMCSGFQICSGCIPPRARASLLPTTPQIARIVSDSLNNGISPARQAYPT